MLGNYVGGILHLCNNTHPSIQVYINYRILQNIQECIEIGFLHIVVLFIASPCTLTPFVGDMSFPVFISG